MYDWLGTLIGCIALGVVGTVALVLWIGGKIAHLPHRIDREQR